MRTIQTLCGEYPEVDIFTMDETGLFWRQALSSGLAATSRHGVRKDKSRISIIYCVNFTGNERLPLWLIGKSKQPRPLKNVNLKALGCEWRGNRKAWMNTAIMVEWLRAFYAFINSCRSVLLLMDSVEAHIAGIEVAPPPSNIRVQWLPPNATSIYQPLDQGIISTTKYHYKKYWLQFMIQHYEQQLNPLDMINLYHTVRWISRAWHFNLSNPTVYQCFRKAKIQPRQQPITLPTQPLPNLTSLYQRVQRVGDLQDIIGLESFLNPEDEDEGIHEQDNGQGGVDLDEIIRVHTGQMEQSDDASEEDEQVDIQPPIDAEALEAVELLRRFQEQQADTTVSDIDFLVNLERTIRSETKNSQQQQTMEGWLM